MPSITKGSKKKKGARGGRNKGAVKIVPDPDAGYKQQLDETFYLSKLSRAKLMNQYTAAVDAAIRANTVSLTSVSPGDFSIPSQIQMVKIPEIVRSLGLCVTDEQIDQICCMVLQTAPLSNPQTELASGEEAIPQPPGVFAETEKVRQVLSEMLHSHILAYDPQVLSHPDPRFPTRVSSVVYKVTEQDLASCFESIWATTGKRSVLRNDGTQVRCFAVDALEIVMADVQHDISTLQPLTQKELEDLYFFVKGENSDVIDEDTFLRCLADV
ncbi:hypothetical protein ABB37_08131 [Leptomonas pyrrhocoris]|uniref:Uncharacterized protein n=1 Tax=Leptomonas pyrrhocoris TaxID=157538 RepID=A0A0M9FTV5_LEPPY|nr:hypothetical protein ABB37_08131 [Leptomonas pyrrhocoris]XP_015654415.1 hypothetical protein ABB37_08131 [Leptomonas pyrrhocoris]KPA75975.1 hypothetical protein ABB37_08131 [Leptomonas pyrrhocoris]KPA75976.1 hypothetical protein ABB37_08131 [Leptomonas pyrrhocoris]|eukprot:XP_015654414.1 hypothetical protein ABB37_08131 [Leptomonas pyrrhocoris]